jgi:uncharacterized protein (DUF2062 family)
MNSAVPEPFSPVVVAPTFNNHRTVIDILQRVVALGLPLIVVDDGSTDATPRLLERWAEQQRDVPVHVLTHARNRGKATAMQTGFAAARAAGYTHAVTIDTDGQLDPEQLPQLIAAAERHPQAYVLGCRDDERPDYPASSRLGRRLSNMLIWIESGVRVEDSQCGMRVYPLDFVATVPCRARYFGFEAEIITRAGWAGCPIVEVPVNCRYFPRGQRVSHFRPLRDTLRAIAMHARLVGRALLPLPRHPRWPRGDESASPWSWRSLMEWISLAKLLHMMRGDHVSQSATAAAFAVGVFIANLPAYGVQTLLSLYAARRLHLHPLAVVAGSHISTPPIGPLLIAAAITVGHLVLYRALPPITSTELSQMSIVTPLLLSWLVGGVIVGVLLALITFVVMMTAFRLLRAEAREEDETESAAPTELPAPSQA